jgi:protein gp37
MGAISGIEWTDATWNPVTGCSKISPGCKFCYAERLAHRLQLMGNPRYMNGFAVTLHADQLALPLRWRAPRRIFVNSMSDLFHEDVPFEFVDRVFDVIAQAPQHVFQILTKRPERLVKWHQIRRASRTIPVNAWMGVSIESDQYIARADALRNVDSRVRFISAEPLLGSLAGLNLSGISWLIVGGESGGSPARALVRRDRGGWCVKPLALVWVAELRDMCRTAGVAFFFKQWGGRTPKSAGRELEGRTWSDYPQTESASLVL